MKSKFSPQWELNVHWMGQWKLMVVAASVVVASAAAALQLLPWELRCQGNQCEELVVWLLPLEPVKLREHQ